MTNEAGASGNYKHLGTTDPCSIFDVKSLGIEE